MVSRDTAVHLGALALALVVVFVASYLEWGVGRGPTAVAVFLLFNGLALGGAHLYLALRGEDGMVPSEARWRYVAMLSVLLGGGALVLYGDGRTVATVTFSTIGTTLIVLTAGVYLFIEALAGYRDSRPE